MAATPRRGPTPAITPSKGSPPATMRAGSITRGACHCTRRARFAGRYYGYSEVTLRVDRMARATQLGTSDRTSSILMSC